MASSTPFEPTCIRRVLEQEFIPTAVSGTRAQATRVAEKRNPRDETHEECVSEPQKSHKSAPER